MQQNSSKSQPLSGRARVELKLTEHELKKEITRLRKRAGCGPIFSLLSLIIPAFYQEEAESYGFLEAYGSLARAN